MADIDGSRDAALDLARRLNEQAKLKADQVQSTGGDQGGSKPPAPATPARTYPLKGKL